MSSVQEFEDLNIVTEEVEFRNLIPGDNLAVTGKIVGIQYLHHGIFIAHEKGVVDFSGISKSKARIQLIDLRDFINGNQPLYRINYSENTRLDRSVTVRNAMDFAENPAKWEQYNLLFNNCEHFATFCVTGKKSSQQVTTAIGDGIRHLFTLASSPSPSPFPFS